MSMFENAGGALALICGIELGFAGEMIPSNIPGFQPFFNSLLVDAELQPTYHGRSTVSFQEDSSLGPAGYSWQQKLSFRFPVGDKFRAERLMELLQVKFVKVKFTSGLHFIIGRNDYFQNAVPSVKISILGNMASVEFSAESISASGYTPNVDRFGLPTLIPISLI